MSRCPNCPPSFANISGAGALTVPHAALSVKVNVIAGPAMINGSNVGVGCYTFGNGTFSLGYDLTVTGLIGSEISIIFEVCADSGNGLVLPVALNETVPCFF